jgi:hypothetical protein
VRVSDQVEGLLLIMVFATAMLVTPIAGAIGTVVYETRARVYAEESQTRHTVTATVVEDSSASLRGMTQTSATVRWQADGIERVGALDLDHETKVDGPPNI